MLTLEIMWVDRQIQKNAGMMTDREVSELLRLAEGALRALQ